MIENLTHECFTSMEAFNTWTIDNIMLNIKLYLKRWQQLIHQFLLCSLFHWKKWFSPFDPIIKYTKTINNQFCNDIHNDFEKVKNIDLQPWRNGLILFTDKCMQGNILRRPNFWVLLIVLFRQILLLDSFIISSYRIEYRIMQNHLDIKIWKIVYH